jgi:hypothetical protein
MRYRPRSRRLVLPALGFWLLVTGTGRAQTAPPALAGRWSLNLELSEQVEEKLGAALRLGAFSPRVAPGPGAAGKNLPPDDRELLGLLRPPVQLVIRQDDSTVAISDAGGFMVTFPTDGRKVKEYLLSGVTIEMTAKWKDGMLTIERKQDHVGWVRETYSIDQARGKLGVILRIKTSSLPRVLEARRVYDPIPGS